MAESCLAVRDLRGSLFTQFFSMAISWRHISQGRVATRLRCGGIFNYDFTANLSLSLIVKEFWKPAKTWQSYRHELGGLLFGTQCIQTYKTSMVFILGVRHNITSRPLTVNSCLCLQNCKKLICCRETARRSVSFDNSTTIILGYMTLYYYYY